MITEFEQRLLKAIEHEQAHSLKRRKFPSRVQVFTSLSMLVMKYGSGINEEDKQLDGKKIRQYAEIAEILQQNLKYVSGFAYFLFDDVLKAVIQNHQESQKKASRKFTKQNLNKVISGLRFPYRLNSEEALYTGAWQRLPIAGKDYYLINCKRIKGSQ